MGEGAAFSPGSLQSYSWALNGFGSGVRRVVAQRWILWFSRNAVFSQEKHTYHRLRETHLPQAGSIQIASEGISLAGKICIKDCDSCNPLYTAPQSRAQCFPADRCSVSVFNQNTPPFPKEVWEKQTPGSGAQSYPIKFPVPGDLTDDQDSNDSRSWVPLCPQSLYNPSSGINTSFAVKEEHEGEPHRSRPSLQQAGPSGCGRIMWTLGCRDHSWGLSPLSAHSPLGLLLAIAVGSNSRLQGMGNSKNIYKKSDFQSFGLGGKVNWAWVCRFGRKADGGREAQRKKGDANSS